MSNKETQPTKKDLTNALAGLFNRLDNEEDKAIVNAAHIYVSVPGAMYLESYMHAFNHVIDNHKGNIESAIGLTKVMIDHQDKEEIEDA